MDIAKLFTNGQSQAVRLPKEYRFDSKEVFVARLDNMVVLYPRKKGWDLLKKGIQRFTDDFMSDRKQPQKSDKRKKI